MAAGAVIYETIFTSKCCTGRLVQNNKIFHSVEDKRSGKIFWGEKNYLNSGSEFFICSRMNEWIEKWTSWRRRRRRAGVYYSTNDDNEFILCGANIASFVMLFFFALVPAQVVAIKIYMERSGTRREFVNYVTMNNLNMRIIIFFSLTWSNLINFCISFFLCR